jgi:hypothetical protein
LEKQVPVDAEINCNLEELKTVLSELNESMELLKKGVQDLSDCPIQIKKY